MGLRMVLDVHPDIEVGRGGRERCGGDASRPGSDRCHPDGCPDARYGRHRGDGADRRSAGCSAHPGADDVRSRRICLRGHTCGSQRVLLKDARPEELLSAIRSVHSGDAALAPSVTRKLMPALRRRARRADRAVRSAQSRRLGTGRPHGERPARRRTRCSPRAEREILTAIAEGLSNDELAERFFLSSSTIRTTSACCCRSLEPATACTSSSSPTRPASLAAPSGSGSSS